MKIQVYDDGAHFWRWRAVAENGRVVADGSEGYDSASNAERAVNRVAEMFQEAAYQIEHLNQHGGGDPPNRLTGVTLPTVPPNREIRET